MRVSNKKNKLSVLDGKIIEKQTNSLCQCTYWVICMPYLRQIVGKTLDTDTHMNTYKEETHV